MRGLSLESLIQIKVRQTPHYTKTIHKGIPQLSQNFESQTESQLS